MISYDFLEARSGKGMDFRGQLKTGVNNGFFRSESRVKIWITRRHTPTKNLPGVPPLGDMNDSISTIVFRPSQTKYSLDKSLKERTVNHQIRKNFLRLFSAITLSLFNPFFPFSPVFSFSHKNKIT